MTVAATSASQVPSTTSAQASASKTGTGKTTGKNSAFDSMLQGAEDTTSTSSDDSNKQPDALQTMLAALNGGLSPLILAMPQEQLQQTNTVSQDAGTSAITATNGMQAMQQVLQNLQLTNGDLATLLQKFGASPSLMRVLLVEQPAGQLSTSLSNHPELLADLEKALSNVAQQVTATPALLTDPKLTVLMQSLLSQLSQQQQGTTDDPSQNSGQQTMPALLGKLQATLSAHTVDVGLSKPEQTASDVATPQTLLNTTNLAVGVPLHLQLQTAAPVANAEPNVVLVPGDQLNNQLADLIVKRAALIEAPGRQEFRIVLQPQGLGEIQVRVEAVGNQISLHFTADNATSKGLLDSGLANLRNQLQSQGIQFNRIEVTTGNNANQGSEYSGLPQERGSGQSFQGRQGDQSSAKRGERAFSIDAIQDVLAEEETQDLDGIDVTA